MEYLMTYGWAIVIVIIVAAALVALGFFDVPTPEAATGFELGAPAAGSWNLKEDGTFNFTMTSSKAYNIAINDVDITNAAGVACTSVYVNSESMPSATGVSVATGQVIRIGADCSALSLGQRSKYNLNIAFNYTNVDGNFAGLADSGTVSGTVSQ